MVGDLCIRIGCLDHRYLRTVFAARDVCHQASFTDDISACEYGYNFNRSSCATNKAAPHRQNPAKLFRMYYFMFDPIIFGSVQFFRCYIIALKRNKKDELSILC